MDQANLALGQAYFDAIAKGDIEATLALLTDDIIYHAPGKSLWAGEYRGKEIFAQRARMVSDLTAGTLELSEVHDILANEEHIIVLATWKAVRKDMLHTWGTVFTIHPRDGKIAKIWVCQGDQYALDAFMS